MFDFSNDTKDALIYNENVENKMQPNEFSGIIDDFERKIFRNFFGSNKVCQSSILSRVISSIQRPTSTIQTDRQFCKNRFFLN